VRKEQKQKKQNIYKKSYLNEQKKREKAKYNTYTFTHITTYIRKHSNNYIQKAFISSTA